MTAMAEVFGSPPRFNLVALCLKTVEKNIRFFCAQLQAASFIQVRKKKKKTRFFWENGLI